MLFGATLLFERRPEFNITAAFHTNSRNELFALPAFLNSGSIGFAVRSVFIGQSFDSALNVIVNICFGAFPKQTSLAFFHIT